MVTYSDIQTALNAGWNVGVIAKPTFMNHAITGDTSKLSTLYIGADEMPIRQPAGFSGNFNKKRSLFSIKIVAATRANLDAFSSEIIRILETKVITGGFWRIWAEPFYKEYPKFVIKQMNGEEIITGSG